MELTDLSKVADKKKFIIAAPEGIYPYVGVNSWNADLDPGGANDVEFVKDLIREISSKVAIDQKRIYATGFSGGARMSSRLACEISNVIAAIGAVAGLRFPEKCARPVSIIAFHGTEDRILRIHLVEASVFGWVENNGCNKTPMTRNISEDVTQISYGGCKGNAEVIFYRVNKGGHVWPDSPMSDYWEKMGLWRAKEINKEINATNLIWGFFESHPMP
jgi:polyhydroxybutyrate depolymerase